MNNSGGPYRFPPPGPYPTITSASGYSKQLDSLDLARQYYQQAIRLKPDLASAYTNLGNLFLSLEQSRFGGKAIELNPAEKSNYYFMGLLLSALEDRQPEAKPFYQKALQLDDSYAEASYELGQFIL
ncbi:MAG: tetratricopeptide repeat protein [Saprospiraceae bacterium]|nr:tetratricopeptide repeat protein [Saprospiraceae bacterium]